MKRLCTICVRGGSQGIPSKNRMLLGGKPLLAHSIDHAHRSGLFDLVLVSSDSTDLLEIAKRWGADRGIRRPDDLATDQAPKLPAIQHAFETAEVQAGARFDVVVDLDATSPLRLPEDVRGAVSLLEASGVSQVVTGTPARRSPYFNLVEVGEDGAVRLSKSTQPPVTRRQDAPACYDLNASVYAWTRQGLLDRRHPFNPDARLYVMPEERSLDIDSPLDARIVRFLMEKR